MDLEANDRLERGHALITSRRGIRCKVQDVEPSQNVAERLEESRGALRPTLRLADPATLLTCDLADPATLLTLRPFDYVFGPAFLTSSLTSSVKAWKFARNMPARRWAWAS